MVDQAAQKRETEYRAGLQAHEASKAARKAKKQERKNRMVHAWKAKSLPDIVTTAIAYLLGPLPALQAAPAMQEASREEVVWATGAEGEQRVADFLGKELNDSWILIAGYRNAKGEIDQLLVGPTGVYAMEIKYVNGTVHCNSENWWRDKSDKYGNVVETDIRIADRRGRSPSQQLNDAANALQAFLDRNLGKGYIRRAVILSHPQSRCGQLRESGVDMVATLDKFNLWGFLGRDSSLSKETIDRIVEVIKKDHAHHNGKSTRK